MLYKHKLKDKRLQSQSGDQMFKEKQRIWTKRSRLRANKKQILTSKNRQKWKDEKKSINELTPSCTRKRGQRVRQNLPENPVATDTTLSHILKNATLRRKSMLMSNPGITDLENCDETLNINKVGRPCREVINVKK